jgi:7-keto-8-aminopelargonate synthetase-like enzyme
LGQARIRVQLSALHTDKDLEFAIEQFKAAKTQCLS